MTQKTLLTPDDIARLTAKSLLTPNDIARVYSIPKSTQAKGRMAGTFAPFVKRGRSVFVLKTDMDAWLASLRRKSTLEPKRAA